MTYWSEFILYIFRNVEKVVIFFKNIVKYIGQAPFFVGMLTNDSVWQELLYCSSWSRYIRCHISLKMGLSRLYRRGNTQSIIVKRFIKVIDWSSKLWTCPIKHSGKVCENWSEVNSLGRPQARDQCIPAMVLAWDFFSFFSLFLLLLFNILPLLNISSCVSCSSGSCSWWCVSSCSCWLSSSVCSACSCISFPPLHFFFFFFFSSFHLVLLLLPLHLLLHSSFPFRISWLGKGGEMSHVVQWTPQCGLCTWTMYCKQTRVNSNHSAATSGGAHGQPWLSVRACCDQGNSIFQNPSRAILLAEPREYGWVPIFITVYLTSIAHLTDFRH